MVQRIPHERPGAGWRDDFVALQIDYWVIGRMLKEGMDVYVPLVDDHAVDAIIGRKDGSTALVQIKARPRDVVFGDAPCLRPSRIPRRDPTTGLFSTRSGWTPFGS
jgi:hypothetical protein